MSLSKCPAWDGYGTQPHHTKIGKRLKCRGCTGKGYVGVVDVVSPVTPNHAAPFVIPYIPTYDPPSPAPTHPDLGPTFPWWPGTGRITVEINGMNGRAINMS